MQIHEDDSLPEPVHANNNGYLLKKTLQTTITSSQELRAQMSEIQLELERLGEALNPISKTIRKRHYTKETSSSQTELEVHQGLVFEGNESAHGGSILEDIKLFKEMHKESPFSKEYIAWTKQFKIWYGINYEMPIHTYTTIVRDALNKKANLHTLRPFSTTTDHVRWTEVMTKFKDLVNKIQMSENGMERDRNAWDTLAEKAVDEYAKWKKELQK
jgi:hypothetical protein